MTVEDRDLGYAKFVEAITRMADYDDPNVTVGIHADQGSDLIVYAATNEFGSDDGRIPERSFLRSTVDEKRDEYFDELADGIGKVLDGKGSNLTSVFRRVGARAAGDVQEKIRNLSSPANAPSTIEKKGSSNPLIDSGRMRASVTFKVNL